MKSPIRLGKLRKPIWLLLLTLPFLYLAWMHKYPNGSWRYRMTVEVETPEGIKTGSAVREVWINARPGIVNSIGNTQELRGEAIVVDMGARGVLFALICDHKGWEGWGTSIVSLKFLSNVDTHADMIRYYSSLKTGFDTLMPSELPMFARFTDPGDRRTIEIVPPEKFAEAFGSGVQLKRVTIEITRDPITHIVDRFLPKITTRKQYEEYLEWLQHLEYADPRRMIIYVYKGRRGYEVGVN